VYAGFAMGAERPGRRSGVQVLRPRPTMIDVAREAGVALKTVSRVVNAEPGVRAATAAKVNRAIARLRYRRNDLARRLRSHAPTATIGLVVEDVTSPRSAAIVGGVEEVVRELGWLVIAASCRDDAACERRLVTAMVERQVDGLLLVPAGDDHRYVRPEVRRGTPAVFLDRPPAGIEADTVLVDDRRGARAGVAGLLGAGHRRIGVVGGPPAARWVAERTAGWREALAAAGVDEESALLRLGVGDAVAAEAAARTLLRGGDPPTALFALSGRLAPGVVRAAAAGAPGVEVLVFDPFPLADLQPVPVTVVDYDAGELGRRGAELLLDRLDGNAGPARLVVLPTTLVRGSSALSRCGRPPT
jgi:LacI family transcriptional regulator